MSAIGVCKLAGQILTETNQISVVSTINCGGALNMNHSRARPKGPELGPMLFPIAPISANGNIHFMSTVTVFYISIQLSTVITWQAMGLEQVSTQTKRL